MIVPCPSHPTCARDVDTLAAGFGRFVRYSLYGAPTHATADGIRSSDTLYAEFLGPVCEQRRDGVKFVGQVWRARARLSLHLPDLPLRPPGGSPPPTVRDARALLGARHADLNPYADCVVSAEFLPPKEI